MEVKDQLNFGLLRRTERVPMFVKIDLEFVTIACIVAALFGLTILAIVLGDTAAVYFL